MIEVDKFVVILLIFNFEFGRCFGGGYFVGVFFNVI